MRRLWLLLPLLVAVGCGDQRPVGGQPSSAKDSLRGLTFVGGAVTVGGRPHALVPGTEISLEFTDDGRVIARAGCNIMQGRVSTDGGTLRLIDGLSMTEMGCDKPRYQQDDLVAALLSGNPTWQLTDAELTITAGADTVRLTEKSVAKPDAPLAGTWTVDTLVDGEVAQSIPAGVPPVTAVFDGRTVRVDTHCNGVSGTYTVDGNEITFELGPSTLMACGRDVMLVENAVREVMAGAATFDVDADRLTLTAASGKALHLRAG